MLMLFEEWLHLHSLSMPAMILSSVDLPEPFKPSTPIFAPGKKDSEIVFKDIFLGGTIFATRFIEYMYCAIVLCLIRLRLVEGNSMLAIIPCYLALLRVDVTWLTLYTHDSCKDWMD